MARITCENATAAINEALHVLHNSPDPSVRQTPFQFHASSCMVIAVLMQWFVTYLCKKLMQLMTPEALAVHCQVIPHLYIRNYLQFQEHFNLKELVERHLEKLQHNDWLVFIDSYSGNYLLLFSSAGTVQYARQNYCVLPVHLHQFTSFQLSIQLQLLLQI